jgi:2,4-dienoyl-CoA reductase-like NADH-dependent reductase (Old Yellow Enzyme family)
MTIDLIEHAKTKAREFVGDLDDPEDDILPVMLCQGPHGLGMLPLNLMDSEQSKDQLALWMTAMLTVSRAEEAVMVTTAWMVTVDRDQVDMAEGTSRVQPSEHPNRTEAVILMCSKKGGDRMISAQLTRHPDKTPDLGDWDDTGDEIEKLGGRFGDAIHWGLEMAEKMPPEMAEIIESAWESDPDDIRDLIQRFVNVARNAERGVLP